MSAQSTKPAPSTKDEFALSELRYRRLFETAQDGILILDAVTGKITDANPYLEKILRYSKSELLGKELWEIGVFKDIVDSKNAFSELQDKGYIRYENLPLQTKDGHKISVEFVSNVYKVGTQEVIQCNIRDITIRKEIEDKVFMQAAALEATVNSVVITNLDGVIQWVNPAFTKLTGYTFDDAVGKSTRILNSGKQDKLFYQNLWTTVLSGDVWHGEIINKRKDGNLYTEEQFITPIKDKRGEIVSFIAIKQDVTDRKNLEKKIESRNAKLEHTTKLQEQTRQAMLNVMEDLESTKKLIELEKAKDDAVIASIGDGLVAVDNDRKVMIINRPAEKILGWTASELLGKEITDLPLEDEGGHLLPLSKRPTTIAIATGEIVRDTYYFVKKDKTRFPIAITVTPIKFSGKTIGLVEIIRDITKEREIDRAKSEFVSLASHQLRTPLGIIKWYLEAMENDEYFKNSPESVRKCFEEICRNNERLLGLVRDLLSVSRIEQKRIKDVPKQTDIIKIVTEIVEQMKIIAHTKNIPLHLEVRNGDIPPVNIDPLRFHEVIENLIGNAVGYTNKNGLVDITVDKTGDTFVISVKDTGIGISQADMPKIFSKFFRSEKAVEHNPEGSGLGLYIAKSYVEGWNGKITLKSIEGKGSTFTISLPIVQKGSLAE